MMGLLDWLDDVLDPENRAFRSGKPIEYTVYSLGESFIVRQDYGYRWYVGGFAVGLGTHVIERQEAHRFPSKEDAISHAILMEQKALTAREKLLKSDSEQSAKAVRVWR